MPNMTLAELEAQQNDPNKPVIPPIEGGDGTKTAADLEVERQKAEAAAKEQQQQAQKTDAELAAEKAEQEAAAKEQRITALRAKPADQLTPEEKTELETAAAAEADDDDEDPAAFWVDVDKLSGDPLELDWTKIKDDAGNPVQPDSPQGALIRQKAVEERAVTRYEQFLMESDPRGYQYLLHRQAGRTDEEFFGAKTTALPDYEKLKESVDLQAAYYNRVLQSKGIPEKQAKMLVDDAVKNKEIFDLVDKEYKTAEAAEQKQIKDLQIQLEKTEKEYTQQVQALSKLIDTEVASANMSIVIPDAKRPGFSAFVKNLVRYDDNTGQFSIVQPITREQLPRQLEALYLQHEGGKLGGLVERQAATLVTRKLKRSLDKSKDPMRSSSDGGKTKKTLGEL